MYNTYGIGTRKNHKVFLLTRITPRRLWSTDIDKALVFFSKEEAKFVIDKFNVPDSYIATITHRP